MTRAGTASSVRLYADENFPLPIVTELRRLGFDVLTMYEDGKANRSLDDEEVLSLAAAHGRAVLTQNRQHFFQLHRRQPDHAGIVACTADPDFPRQAERIATALGEATQLTGQLVRVYRPA